MFHSIIKDRISLFLFIFVFGANIIAAQTTEFTYQEKLNDGSTTANANYDFEFRLYDAATGGTQIGSFIARNNVLVVNGIFSVRLDFGAGFSGADRFLEIRVRVAGGAGFTILEPRQKVTSSSYSVQSLNATNATNAANAITANTANNAAQLGGGNAGQFVQTTDAPLTDARNPLPFSQNYIQNSATQQFGSSNFNISGSGTANSYNAITQYNINGNRVLSIAGFENTFVGLNTGTANTGSRNSFFGMEADRLNTAGNDNSFFGKETGESNTTPLTTKTVGSKA